MIDILSLICYISLLHLTLWYGLKVVIDLNLLLSLVLTSISNKFQLWDSCLICLILIAYSMGCCWYATLATFLATSAAAFTTLTTLISCAFISCDWLWINVLFPHIFWIIDQFDFVFPLLNLVRLILGSIILYNCIFIDIGTIQVHKICLLEFKSKSFFAQSLR